jgi:hypothetical protein
MRRGDLLLLPHKLPQGSSGRKAERALLTCVMRGQLIEGHDPPCGVPVRVAGEKSRLHSLTTLTSSEIKPRYRTVMGLAHPFASLIQMRVPCPLSRFVRQGGRFDFPLPDETARPASGPLRMPLATARLSCTTGEG